MNLTKWEHYKHNHYHIISALFIILGMLGIAFGENNATLIYWPIVMCVIALIVIPVANHYSWKSKQ